MELSVIVEIISVIGTVVVCVCGYFIRSVRADIRNLGVQTNTKIDKLDEKVNTKIDKLDEKVNTLTASVAAIAATQAEHGIKLQHMMGHGERISALEGATFGTAAT